jgi:hypothetical protein
MRRQRRHIRIGDRLQNTGTIVGQASFQALPRSSGRSTRTPFNLETRRIWQRKIRDILRGLEFRRAAHDPWLPGYLVEVVIMQYQDNQAAGCSTRASISKPLRSDEC